MTWVGEAALFEEGCYRRSGMCIEVFVEGFEEGVKTAAEVDAAVVTLDGEEGDLTLTFPSVTLRGFSAISKSTSPTGKRGQSGFGEGACMVRWFQDVVKVGPA
jgi:hypothetical protein